MEGYIARKAGLVVSVDVAPDELLSKMRWLRKKPVPTDIMHGQPQYRIFQDFLINLYKNILILICLFRQNYLIKYLYLKNIKNFIIKIKKNLNKNQIFLLIAIIIIIHIKIILIASNSGIEIVDLGVGSVGVELGICTLPVLF